MFGTAVPNTRHLPQILKIVDTAIFGSIISERAYKNNELDIKKRKCLGIGVRKN